MTDSSDDSSATSGSSKEGKQTSKRSRKKGGRGGGRGGRNGGRGRGRGGNSGKLFNDNKDIKLSDIEFRLGANATNNFITHKKMFATHAGKKHTELKRRCTEQGKTLPVKEKEPKENPTFAEHEAMKMKEWRKFDWELKRFQKAEEKRDDNLEDSHGDLWSRSSLQLQEQIEGKAKEHKQAECLGCVIRLMNLTSETCMSADTVKHTPVQIVTAVTKSWGLRQQERKLSECCHLFNQLAQFVVNSGFDLTSFKLLEEATCESDDPSGACHSMDAAAKELAREGGKSTSAGNTVHHQFE